MSVVRVIRYGSESIRYELRYLASRRTLGIEVHPDGGVVVRAPVGYPEAQIIDRVRKRARWISRQLAEFDGYRPRTPERQYIPGETHSYLGRQHRLKLSAGAKPEVRIARGVLSATLPDPSDRSKVRNLILRWRLRVARQVFGEILEASLARVPGTATPRLIVRAMNSRWGSLSNAGTMTLNVKLLGASRQCIEYVITHELCHVRHRNHDSRFFRLLGQVMPDWERRKRRLEAALL